MTSNKSAPTTSPHIDESSSPPVAIADFRTYHEHKYVLAARITARSVLQLEGQRDSDMPSYTEGLTVLTNYTDAIFALTAPEFGQGEFRSQDPNGKLVGDSVISQYGSAHFERRRLEATLFKPSTLKMYEDGVAHSLSSKLSQLLASPDDDGLSRIDLLPLLHSVLLAVTFRLVGLDTEDDNDDLALYDHYLSIANGVLVRYSTQPAATVLREAEAARDHLLKQYFEPAWNRREKLIAEVAAGRLEQSAVPNDLISLMIRNRKYFDSWDELLVLREATLFIHASATTTTNTTPFVIDEICRWVGDDPDRAAKIADEEFLTLAINEAIRLHPTLPILRRIAREAVTLPSGQPLQEGEIVGVSLADANLDEEVFGADAAEFNPFRTLPRGVDRSALGFGGGPHTCIGKPLVLGSVPGRPNPRNGTMKTVLIELFRNGVRPDPHDPATKETDILKDAYKRYPVLLEQA